MSEKAKKNEEDFSFKCPSCTKGIIKIQKTIYDSQDGDQILILKYECNDCGYLTKDVVPLSSKMKPGVILMRIKNEKDLGSMLYRSPTGKLEIPELELVVEPGPKADFYLTTIEGILFKFESAVKIYKNSLEYNDPEFTRVSKIIDDLQEAKKGKFPFTLKITDNAGGSYIMPQDETQYSFEPLNNDNETDNDNDFKIV
ncbi:MAG: ZPR1 zinc finger domain-containing protein [Promethearchaeota archaeon]